MNADINPMKPKIETVPAVEVSKESAVIPAEMTTVPAVIHPFEALKLAAYARICQILPKKEADTFRISVRNKTFDGKFVGIALPDHWKQEQVKFCKHLADIGATYAKLAALEEKHGAMKASVKGMTF